MIRAAVTTYFVIIVLFCADAPWSCAYGILPLN